MLNILSGGIFLTTAILLSNVRVHNGEAVRCCLPDKFYVEHTNYLHLVRNNTVDDIVRKSKKFVDLKRDFSSEDVEVNINGQKKFSGNFITITNDELGIAVYQIDSDSKICTFWTKQMNSIFLENKFCIPDEARYRGAAFMLNTQGRPVMGNTWIFPVDGKDIKLNVTVIVDPTTCEPLSLSSTGTTSYDTSFISFSVFSTFTQTPSSSQRIIQPADLTSLCSRSSYNTPDIGLTPADFVGGILLNF